MSCRIAGSPRALAWQNLDLLLKLSWKNSPFLVCVCVPHETQQKNVKRHFPPIYDQNIKLHYRNLYVLLENAQNFKEDILIPIQHSLNQTLEQAGTVPLARWILFPRGLVLIDCCFPSGRRMITMSLLPYHLNPQRPFIPSSHPAFPFSPGDQKIGWLVALSSCVQFRSHCEWPTALTFRLHRNIYLALI